MRRGVAIALAVVGTLVLAALVGKVWLIDSAEAPAVSTYALDLEAIRELSASLPGPLPRAVNSILVTRRSLPAWAVVAGSGLGSQEMVDAGYQVVWPDASLVIDTAVPMDPNDSGVSYHPERFEALQAAMRRADAIVITHEHADHVGGLARSPSLDALLPRVVLTAEQAGNAAQMERAKFPPEALAALTPLRYEGTHVLRPGVVLIKAPGHTPGSQMIYVRTQDGRERLFVGDIAWNRRNVTELTGRPRLVTDWFLGEDRDAVLAQLRTLYDLVQAEDVTLVVAHDGDLLRENIASGSIGAVLE